MTEPDLTTILEEAEHIAEQHEQVARTTDNQAHESLRYAVLRVLEGEARRGEADHLPADWTPVGGVTVGSGGDEAMFVLGLVTGYTTLNESGLLAIVWGAITLTCLSSAVGLVSTDT